ncbi:protealysin inhibitor emfourin [Myxococcus landrumensis]|uniref:Uncharacterized protein n=1 Tax=Myxococcus landrumensis TaxID=2813577 RepID=A0ABX7N5H3_9BACT|nr:protealysin inhibitor emfourin [Myxococcus landrumus]QSQ13997.1 hypothetical protein JY572_37730 [Myxococcus landrumus]
MARGGVRLQLSQHGGLAAFPGLARPRSVELDALPAEEAKALEDSLRAARFLELPPVVGSATHGADRRSYTLTVEEEGRSHTVQVMEPVEDSHLRELLSRAKKATRRRSG